MTTISTERDVVTLVNVFTVAPEDQQRLVDLLVEATETTMNRVPGFVSANIHRSLDWTRVVNYAQWRTREDFEAMLKNPEVAPHMRDTAPPTGPSVSPIESRSYVAVFLALPSAGLPYRITPPLRGDPIGQGRSSGHVPRPGAGLVPPSHRQERQDRAVDRTRQAHCQALPDAEGEGVGQGDGADGVAATNTWTTIAKEKAMGEKTPNERTKSFTPIAYTPLKRTTKSPWSARNPGDSA